ncbi:MAG: DNA polymerase III subunit beta [Firmicutes bacterium]|nr:DNA polymerase III subunit beta [Bacillota bacterium]
MKLTVDGLDLAEAVATVARAANAKAINPVLEGIKLTATKDTLTLSATDLEIFLQKTIRADIKQQGTVIVPGRLFAEYVRKLDKSSLSITSDGQTVVIKHADNICNFQCLPADEYPSIINLTEEPYFSIKSEALRDLISKTTICTSQDDSRPVLKGVLFELYKDTLTGVALDGFRMAKVEKSIANYKDAGKIIVPARSLDEVRKLLSDDNGEVNVVVENKFLQISVGNTIMATRLIDGEFINYAQIMPKEFTSDAVVEKSHFENAVERAGLLVRSDRVNLVTIKVGDKQVAVSSTNEIGRINEKVAASLTGKDVTIAFNAKYLFDALRNIQNDFIKLQLTGEHSPAIITAAKDGDFTFLVLPVRIS